MSGPTRLADLEAYAKRCLAADRYPHDRYVFRAFACDTCGVVAFRVAIEHHTGSERGDFKGVIWGDCTACGGRKRLFCFTGEHRRRAREDKPTCGYGNAGFLVGECERIEGDQGLAGFFDLGIVVGMCSRCGHNRAFVYTD